MEITITLTLEEEFALQDAIEARVCELQDCINGTEDNEIISAAEWTIRTLEAIREKIENE